MGWVTGPARSGSARRGLGHRPAPLDPTTATRSRSVASLAGSPCVCLGRLCRNRVIHARAAAAAPRWGRRERSARRSRLRSAAPPPTRAARRLPRRPPSSHGRPGDSTSRRQQLTDRRPADAPVLRRSLFALHSARLSVLAVRPSVCPSVCPSVRLSVRPFCQSVRPSVVILSVRLLDRLFEPRQLIRRT